MPELKVYIPATLRYNGLFDFDGLYAGVVDWAKNYGYRWHEKTFKHKVPTPRGAEQELEWNLTKKVTDYFVHEITLTIHTWDQTEVEVEINNRKKPLTNARMYIILSGKMVYDWQNRFKGSKFLKKLGHWYYTVINKKELESIYYDQFHYRQMDLHALLKKYFDMQTQKYSYQGYLGEN